MPLFSWAFLVRSAWAKVHLARNGLCIAALARPFVIRRSSGKSQCDDFALGLRVADCCVAGLPGDPGILWLVLGSWAPGLSAAVFTSALKLKELRREYATQLVRGDSKQPCLRSVGKTKACAEGSGLILDPLTAHGTALKKTTVSGILHSSEPLAPLCSRHLLHPQVWLSRSSDLLLRE